MLSKCQWGTYLYSTVDSHNGYLFLAVTVAVCLDLNSTVEAAKG